MVLVVDDQRAGTGTVHDTVLSEQDLLHVRRAGEHGEDRVAPGGQGGGRLRGRRPALDQRLEGDGPIAVRRRSARVAPAAD